ncbi:lysozyme [Rheinheimera sp. MMS21-TC3]|uniref:lysozyme n=1 Tax=Rheinheimera sp. MMS21-TC3 TaxID=3072790 RepID=UPI0028C49DFF|nr:lysozyme [Rheinheimera sp. MMS21-TC3]WNO60876.1 lysozyme [Rheinheimera sp. MMS21-TC3]
MNNIAKRLAVIGLAGALATTGAMIADSEGYVPGTYIDPVGIITACFGHTSKELKLGVVMSDQQCLELLAKDLVNHNQQLLSAVNVPLSEQEHAAYLSFHYNVGAANFRSSTLLKYLNAGSRVEACNQLTRWVYARGVKLNGLIKRRSHERDLCLSGVLNGQH